MIHLSGYIGNYIDIADDHDIEMLLSYTCN